MRFLLNCNILATGFCVCEFFLLTLRNILYKSGPDPISAFRIMLHIKYIITLLLCTLASVLPLRGQERFERRLEQITFVPKGQWITGVSVGYSQSSEDNYKFLILENLNGNSYTFKVSPMLMYAFADNLAAGGRFAYSRQMTRLDAGSVKLDPETGFDIDHMYSISQTFYSTAAMRQYISLGSSTRFGLLNELQLQVGNGQSKLTNGTGTSFTGTYSRNLSVDVGLAPGMVVFLNNYSALECNVGVLGFSYTHKKATTDRIHVGETDTKYANFKVNLFSILFGVTFYL